ncbi:MAG TPA: hypothetical protein VME46_21920, partial [Acidimicrobiales bacterium]|nr:hypothetical protein [Acidimicrobiales bacterium]
MYASLSALVSRETFAMANRPLVSRFDPILQRSTSYSVGFQLQTPDMPLGPVADAFGHGGNGGSLHGCWPGRGLGFSYSMNLMRDLPQDPRGLSLLRALHGCLEGAGR